MSKMRREELLEEEPVSSRIRDPYNNMAMNHYEDYCRYAMAKLEDCLNKSPV